MAVLEYRTIFSDPGWPDPVQVLNFLGARAPVLYHASLQASNSGWQILSPSLAGKKQPKTMMGKKNALPDI